jgi:hypothetical protein
MVLKLKEYQQKVQKLYEIEAQRVAFRAGLSQVERSIKKGVNDLKNMHQLIKNEQELQESFRTKHKIKLGLEGIINNQIKIQQETQLKLKEDVKIKEKFNSIHTMFTLKELLTPNIPNKVLSIVKKEYFPILTIVEAITQSQQAEKLRKEREDLNSKFLELKAKATNLRTEAYNKVRSAVLKEQARFNKAKEQGVEAVFEYKYLKKVTKEQLQNYKKEIKTNYNKTIEERQPQNTMKRIGFDYRKIADIAAIEREYRAIQKRITNVERKIKGEYIEWMDYRDEGTVEQEIFRFYQTHAQSEKYTPEQSPLRRELLKQANKIREKLMAA